jgi:hypothetical protein
LFAALKQAERNGKPLQDPENRKFLAAIFTQILKSAAAGMFDSVIYQQAPTLNLLQSGILPPETLVEIYNRAAKTAETAGQVFAAISFIHRSTGNLAEAETACREAMNRAAVARRFHLLGNFTLDFAEIRAELGRPGEAIRIANSIPPGQRDTCFARRFAGNMRKWQRLSKSPGRQAPPKQISKPRKKAFPRTKPE